MRSSRYWVIVVVLFLAIAVVHRRGDVDKVPQSIPLDQMPMLLDGRAGVDVPLDGYVLDVLGKGVFLNRTYISRKVAADARPLVDAPIGLFIAYFPTQRTGQAIHSPQNCLPGSGWTFDSQRVTTIKDENGTTYRVGDYLISNGKDRDEVFYWYRSHGRTIANDYKAKWYTLTDSILYNRTDAALIRVVTPLRVGEDQDSARRRVAQFSEHLAPLLSAYIPN
jgi:EpsI family protein